MDINEKATAFLAAARHQYGASTGRAVPAARVALGMGIEYAEALRILQELEARCWARLTGSPGVLGDLRLFLTPAGVSEVDRLSRCA